MSDSGSEDARELDLVGEEGDFADWEEENEEPRLTRCLFSSETHASPDAALRHAAQAFGFDLSALYKQHAMDFYGAIQCLNYARACAAEHASDPAAAAAAALAGIANGEHRDEKFLAPALEDDPVLFDWEDFVGVGVDPSTVEDDQAAEDAARRATDAIETNSVEANRAAVASLRAENEALRLRALELSQRLGETRGEDDILDASPANVGARVFSREPGGSLERREPASANAARGASRAAGGGESGGAPRPPGRRIENPKRAASEAVDANYFGSYSFFDIHRVMLDDVSRTSAYRVALEQNPSCVRDKNVLDVGCGTGILSMFAARGGARRVVGVDAAADIAAVARANVAHNGLDDVIQIVQGKVEDLLERANEEGSEGSSLEKNSFDVLVSEWMGYALLFESMFDTVIEARDALLKPGGAILPDIATIHVAGFGRNATSLPFWDDVYGFEMPTVQTRLMSDAIKSATVAPVKGEHVVTESAEVKRLDLSIVTVKELDFTSCEVELVPRADGIRGDEHDPSVTAGKGEGAAGLARRSTLVENAGGPVMVHGVVLWFDTLFSERFCVEKPGVLSTSPHERQTHWAQTMLHFPEPIAIHAGGGGEVPREDGAVGVLGSAARPAAKLRVRVGMAKCAEEENARALDISLEYVTVGADGVEGVRKARMYRV